MRSHTTTSWLDAPYVPVFEWLPMRDDENDALDFYDLHEEDVEQAVRTAARMKFTAIAERAINGAISSRRQRWLIQRMPNGDSARELLQTGSEGATTGATAVARMQSLIVNSPLIAGHLLRVMFHAREPMLAVLLQGMLEALEGDRPVALQTVEVVNHFVLDAAASPRQNDDDSAELVLEFSRNFLGLCLQACYRLEDRPVGARERQTCMLIKSLLVEHQVLALSGYLLIEVQTLLLEFSRLREASELYQLVMKVAAMDAR